MKMKFLFLLLLLITLTGCKNNNVDSDKQAYDINEKSDEIRNKVKYSLNNAERTGFNNSGDNKKAEKDPINIYQNDVVYENDDEEINEAEIIPQSNSNELSSFSTKILTNDNNRYNNISIVADRLNNYVLKPGETFSFNKVCGPYGASDGFLEATILLSDGTHDKGYGGGVCQLSSTLYNAIKNLNVKITERHHHSVPVAYVPKNEDATVSLQSNLDFKFVNNSGKTLKFTTSHDPNNLKVVVEEV